MKPCETQREVPDNKRPVEEVYLDEEQAPVIKTWERVVEDLHVATAKDWKNKPMSPDQCYVIRTDIPIPEVVMERIRQGHLPTQMEDKWFMFFENNTIRYFRSWSGFNIFNAYCEKKEQGYAITKIEVDTENYNSSPQKAPDALLAFLQVLARQCGVSLDEQIGIYPYRSGR